MPDDLKNLTPVELAIYAHAQKYEGYDNIGVRRAELIKLLADLDAAREIIVKLPMTVDGVPIVPGMQLWGVYHGVGQYSAGSGTIKNQTWNPRFSDWARYSTRAAALAAKGTVGT
jgi:hypothetical protein